VRARAARFAHGHPVACTAALLREAYAADREPEPLRDVLRREGDAVRVLAPEADALSRDLDEIDDVVRLTGAPPVFFSWSPS
jgi:CTP:molybdopterin cytidylyltransferase MocA